MEWIAYESWALKQCGFRVWIGQPRLLCKPMSNVEQLHAE